MFKPPYLIAEISANHCGSLSLAKKLIKCAKENGSDAVKIQTYTPDSMTIKSNKKYFKIKNGLWKGYDLWSLYNKAHTPLAWHKELFKYAKKLKIKIFSTPFDESAVDFLEKLKCPIYKVASFEMTDLPLIKRIAKTKKPMIISTGMASLKEIELTYNTAKKNGAKDITLLYCVSNYPSSIKDFNLNNIKILKEKFKCKVGLSDHSKNNKVAAAAVAAGAELVEKHIALEKQKKGLDIEFSLKGKEIKKFKDEMNLSFQLLGKKEFYRNKNENKSKIFRRSLFVVNHIKKGEKISKKNIRRIRPGYGLEPKYYEKLLGKKSPYNIKSGEPLRKNILKKLRIK
jgi:pseudaminic acid synthase